MTTATRRLRRASVAGLATIATVGGAIVATGGTAFAAELGVTDQVASGSATTVYPGTSSVSVGDLQIAIPNSFAIGDTVTVDLAAAGGPGCGTTNGAVGYSATPSVTATGGFTTALGSTAGDTADTTPKFTVATASSAGACTTAGVKDKLVITLTNSATGTAGNFYTLTVSGTKVNVGSAVKVGAVNETPEGAGASAAAVAAVASTKLSAASVVSGTNGATVNLGALTATDVVAGTIQGNITYTLNKGNWAAATTTNAKIAGPTGVTWAFAISSSGIVGHAANDVLTATSTGTIPTTSVNSFVLTGASVTLGAIGTSSDVAAAFTGGGGGTIGAAVPVAVAVNSARIGGTDRYATAAQLFDNGPISGSTAVLASGANFPDALSANYLASWIGTGILLTDPNNLPTATQQAIITKSISTVYIVGGTAAVSQSVQDQIAAMHVGNVPGAATVNVIRIAGADRYATNNAVDLYFGAGGASNTAIVAVGSNFADALSVGPAIYRTGDVLVLTDGASLSASAQSTLVNLGISHVIIVGGTAAVSSAVETSIKALSGVTVDARLAGADRTLTAAEIASWETATGTFAVTGYNGIAGLGFIWGVGNAVVNISRGDVFADALAAGPFAGNSAEVILLTGDPTNLGPGIPSFLGGNSSHLNTVQALGLTAAVSVSELNAAIASSAS